MHVSLDFTGRLRKIRAPLSLSIHAVFEAVANSFDSTDDLGEQGRITVRILLQRDGLLFDTPDNPEYKLRGYEIEDNGVGFDTKNMDYFRHSDTTNKAGGQGVGRLLWLKVFDRAEIESIYSEGGRWWKRSFTFSPQNIGVDDDDANPQSVECGPCKTIVRLLVPKRDRVPFLPQNTDPVAARLLEHFLLYFAVLKGQKVTVMSDVEEPVDVSSLYVEMIGDRHKQESLNVGEHEFSLHHLFVKPTTTRKNLIRFCARRRVVESETVSSLIPEVSIAKPVTLQGIYRYHAYVTGDYLDQIVDDERSTLRWPKNREKDDADEPEDTQLSLLVPDEGADTGIEGVSKEECCACIAERIGEYLKDHISDVRAKRERLIEDFAHKEQPQFRPFVNSAKGKLGRLPARPSKKQIEMALYEAKIDGRADMEKTVNEIVKKVASADQVAQQSRYLMDKFATEANRQSISALAEYVCTRKAVIDVLKANLAKQTDGKYGYEDVVHDLFFPRHCTSNQFPVGPLGPDEREIENLWLIDERLVFHRLLTSDKPLSTLKKLLVADVTVIADVSEKNDEPDILIFDPAFVTTESASFSSLGIVEFKRPGRDDYSLSDNPVQQIIEIANKIRLGKQVETRTGEIQAISDDVRFYGYAVCDILGPLEGIIKNTHRMRHTPDGIGYYMFHEELNMLIEVIPYSKIVSDAERRNAAFFKKLNM